MRLFIAIEFPEPVKAELEQSAAILKENCDSGNFSRRENYHLTLAFLGEIAPARVNAIEDAMRVCAAPPIPIRIGAFGTFSRDGDLIFRRVEASKDLFALQKDLADALRARGFSPEDRAFKPHLTMAREVRRDATIPLSALSAQVPPLSLEATAMSLMRSDRVAGKLVYTRVAQTNFTR